MAAEAEAAAVVVAVVKIRPAPDGRAFAVCPHDPTSPPSLEIRMRAPVELHPRGLRMFHQDAMQASPAHPTRKSGWKIGSHRGAAIVEANTAEGKRGSPIEMHADIRQGSQRIRHEPFAASLVGGGRGAIQNGDLATFAAQRNSRRESRRSSADHHNIAARH